MRHHNPNRSWSKIRGLLVRLAAIVFACRALIPIGYMPASLGEGGPVVLCHGGMAGAFFRALSETQAATDAHMHMADHSAGTANAHQHPDENSAVHQAWDNCPVGAAFSAAPIPQEFALSLPEPEHEFAQAEPDALVHIAFVSPYRARAPPASFSRHPA